MGLGTKRNLDDYAKLSGIDLRKKEVLDMDQATRSDFLVSQDWKINPLK